LASASAKKFKAPQREGPRAAADRSAGDDLAYLRQPAMNLTVSFMLMRVRMLMRVGMTMRVPGLMRVLSFVPSLAFVRVRMAFV
jgi:hypothetical protein